jgi:hypothetical protein
MKIPHKELERVRRNPGIYRGVNLGASHPFSSYPTASMFRLALMEYHKSNLISEAISYFETSFDAHRKETKANKKTKDEFITYLMLYDESYNDLGVSTFKAFPRIAVPLNREVLSSGEVLRIDIIPQGGYSTYILEKESREWRNELRMPLIQSFLSNELNCHPGEIRVGMYFYQSGAHSSTTYTSKEIRRAVEEASEIADILSE